MSGDASRVLDEGCGTLGEEDETRTNRRGQIHQPGPTHLPPRPEAQSWVVAGGVRNVSLNVFTFPDQGCGPGSSSCTRGGLYGNPLRRRPSWAGSVWLPDPISAVGDPSRDSGQWSYKNFGRHFCQLNHPRPLPELRLEYTSTECPGTYPTTPSVPTSAPSETGKTSTVSRRSAGGVLVREVGQTSRKRRGVLTCAHTDNPFP